MEVIYKAFDGRIFSNEKECLVYESKNSGVVQMWDESGVGTPATALVLNLGSSEKAGGNRFIEMCKMSDATYAGIEFNEEEPEFSWWYWDEFENTFRYLTPDVRQALIHAYSMQSEAFAHQI